MKDQILEMFFQPKRWEDALNKGAIKGIKPQVLREFMSPDGRLKLLGEIVSGNYHIERPHTAKIPKDTPGEYRTVFVNNDRDRIFLSLVNDLLFEIMGDMVHPSCTSYQKGTGCGRVVQEASEKICNCTERYNMGIIGWKSDLSKYFDSVPIRYIDEAFDKVEERWGKSKIIDIVREYYHNDLYYDSELKKEVTQYQSLKQGCAVAAWLADVILYHIDEKLTTLVKPGNKFKECGLYVRYSDDTLFIGKDYKLAMQIMEEELGKMEMKLNPKKVEYLDAQHWFKFLGYSIKGKQISLSRNRIKTFAKEVTERTIKKIHTGVSYKKALESVYNWLYRGEDGHSWATSVLRTINVQEDIDKLNGFVMDCLRAVKVGKSVNISDLGGLGWVKQATGGCIDRGKGKKVRTLIDKTGLLEDYHTLGCMRNNLLYGRAVYDTIVRSM